MKALFIAEKPSVAREFAVFDHQDKVTFPIRESAYEARAVDCRFQLFLSLFVKISEFFFETIWWFEIFFVTL